MNTMPLDGDVIAELQDVFGADFHALVESFLGDSTQRLAALHAAVAAAEAPGIRAAAHSLKGSARNLGAVQLAAVAERLEHDGRDGHLDAAARSLAEVAERLDAARDALLAAILP